MLFSVNLDGTNLKKVNHNMKIKMQFSNLRIINFDMATRLQQLTMSPLMAIFYNVYISNML